MNIKLMSLAVLSGCLMTLLTTSVFGSSLTSEQGQFSKKKVNNSLITKANSVPVKEILPKLKGKTSVPIFLPSELPFFPPQESPFNGKFYYGVNAKKDSYDVTLDLTANCQGSTPCSRGAISGEKGRDFITPMNGVTKSYKKVELVGGIKGIFHNGCGAYCTATLQWKYQGFLYSIYLKNGLEKDAIAIGNSAIKAGVRQ
ncbi:MAG: hypothetical protein RLZZ338_4204 [Cyanobacteriota bacterium]